MKDSQSVLSEMLPSPSERFFVLSHPDSYRDFSKDREQLYLDVLIANTHKLL